MALGGTTGAEEPLSGGPARTDPHQTAYLIRHADVFNPDKVVYGHLPGFHLSPRGVEQARRLADQLADAGIEVIVHSPLQRAEETARILAARWAGSRVYQDPRLTEAEFGRYLQGVGYPQVPFRRPLWLIHWVRRGLLANDESVSTMAARVTEAILDAVRQAQGRRVAFVSHADPIQAVWTRLLANPDHRMNRLVCDRTGYLVLDVSSDQLKLVRYVAPAPGG